VQVRGERPGGRRGAVLIRVLGFRVLGAPELDHLRFWLC
jgi:hypothetical protein